MRREQIVLKMSEKEGDGGSKPKRLIDSLDDEEKRSMRKKPRVDYSEEKKPATAPTPSASGEPVKVDDDDDIQVNWIT